MTTEPPDLALTTLRKRWEADPAPQLSLKLAEEYRRRQEMDEAIRVLRKGLESRPGHVASRVALGRYLFLDGALDEARAQLEEITSEDPTHLVANKLLVRTHLEVGDFKNARERLDLYTLLNDGDPDIEELESRFEGSVSETAESVAEAEEPAIVEPARPVHRAEPEPTEADLFSTARPPQTDVAGDLFGSAWKTVRSPAKDAVGQVFDLGVAASDLSSPEPAPDIDDASPHTAETIEETTEEATVTLGVLYLEQGHRQQARQVFQQILDREPENRAARVGLRSAEADASWGLTAATLLTPEQLAAGEAAQWKQSLLTAYLGRLKSVTGAVGG